MQHPGRVPATGERRYAVGRCDGTLTVEAERLVVQGQPHPNGRVRTPTVIERADVAAIHVRCGLLGARVQRELPSGYRADLIRPEAVGPLLEDLAAHAWPVHVTGWRRPR